MLALSFVHCDSDVKFSIVWEPAKHMYKISVDHSYAEFSVQKNAPGAIFCTVRNYLYGNPADVLEQFGVYFVSIFENGENTKDFIAKQYD